MRLHLTAAALCAALAAPMASQAADQIGYQIGNGNTNTLPVDPAHPLPVSGNGMTAAGNPVSECLDSLGAACPVTAGAAQMVVTKTAFTTTGWTQYSDGGLPSSGTGSVLVCPAVPNGSNIVTTEIWLWDNSAAPVGIGMKGQTLTTAAMTAAASVPDIKLSTAGTIYTKPVGASNGISGYDTTGNAGVTCVQTLRPA